MGKVNKSGSGTSRRKFRRGLPDSLAVLSSLVSFDDAETEESKVGCQIGSRNERSTAERQANTSFESDRKLTRISSEPFPSGKLYHEAAPTLRKTLSQDWFNTNFSPRPRTQPRRSSLWGSGCLYSQHLLSNVPSLRSIPEGSELDDDDGSELSDDNFVMDVDPLEKSLNGKRNTHATDGIGDGHEKGKKRHNSRLHGE